VADRIARAIFVEVPLLRLEVGMCFAMSNAHAKADISDKSLNASQ
jgi:hypothetical protein